MQNCVIKKKQECASGHNIRKNYLCFLSECPLTLAVQLEESCDLIKVLRSGGAHLDFRTRDGITALHRAVLCRNSAALTVSTSLNTLLYYHTIKWLPVDTLPVS